MWMSSAAWTAEPTERVRYSSARRRSRSARRRRKSARSGYDHRLARARYPDHRTREYRRARADLGQVRHHNRARAAGRRPGGAGGGHRAARACVAGDDEEELMQAAAKSRERSIILTPDEAAGLAAGRITLLVRAMRKQPKGTANDWSQNVEDGEVWMYHGWPHRMAESRGRHKRAAGELTPVRIPWPFGSPGTRLAGRETWGW